MLRSRLALITALASVGCGARPPTISVQPADQSVEAGTTATFSVTASVGKGSLTYKWFQGASAISGASAASYTTPPTRPADNGAKFSVVIYGSAGGAVSSDLATLTVTPAVTPRGTFTLTAGPLAAARTLHTATLLANGKVLLTGGVGADDKTLATAELFDPVTSAFTSTGSMTNQRSRHAATLLPNGTVLVTGGEGLAGVEVSAELYDPATGVFAPTGMMTEGRSRHTATLLASGKVLIAGGVVFAQGAIRASAELFDPAGGTFSATGSMANARYLHIATLLKDGRLLIAGGASTDAGGSIINLKSAELFDPTTASFSATGPLATARSAPLAALLTNDTVLIAGGATDVGVVASAELFDPIAGTFKATVGPMPHARTDATATLIKNGNVLIAGGWDRTIAGSAGILEANAFDAAAGVFSIKGFLAVARTNHTATLLANGRVLVAGGSNSMGYVGSAELYW